MLDIKWIRENPEAFDAGMRRRGLSRQTAALLELDKARRDALNAAQAIQAERNALSKEIGARKARGEDAADLIEAVGLSKQRQAEAEEAARQAEADLNAALALVPNLPAADVPDGADESANVEVRRWGDPPSLARSRRCEHDALGEGLGGWIFCAPAGMSGARFTVLRGALARLERALAAFMLDLHTSRIRLHRDQPAGAGPRRGAVRHRPTAEVRRRSVPHHRRPLADPDGGGAADQSRRRRDRRRGAACRAASRR